jgi:hypothetical protein
MLYHAEGYFLDIVVVFKVLDFEVKETKGTAPSLVLRWA